MTASDIRPYQNASLPSPVDADLLFTMNSQSTPQWIESATTMAQLAAYISSKVGSLKNLQTVYYSTKGSSGGSGTIGNPFATPNQAITYALTLSPTASNPIVIYGDAGTYQITNGAIFYPNLIFAGQGVTWTTNGTVTSITYAPNSFWTTTPSKIYLNGITIDSTLTLNLDTTGITNFRNTTHLQNFNSVANTTFKFGSSAHQGSISLDGNVQLASGSGSSFTQDSIFFTGNPGHQIAPTGQISLLATNNITSFASVGHTGLGLVQITSSTTRSINFQASAGSSSITFSIDATKAGSVSLSLDNTTLPPALNGMITGTNYSFINTSVNGYSSQSTLTDGASVTWDIGLCPFSLWLITGNSHTISPINLYSDAFVTLTIQQDATGGWTPSFSSAFQFPLGGPNVDTTANAVTTLQFICTDAANLVCITTPKLANVVSSASQTLAWGSLYYANDTVLTTFTLPSASFPAGAKPIKICGINTGGWSIAQNSGQTIISNSGGVAGVNQTTTGTGGSISSTDPYDMIEIIPQSATTAIVSNVKGNLTIV